MQQPRDFLWFERPETDLPQQFHGLTGFQKRQLMPAFEMLVQPEWHRQHPVKQRPIVRPQAKPGRNKLPDKAAVKSVTGDGDAIRTQDILVPAFTFTRGR